MPPEKPTHDDLHDRLLDRLLDHALRETLGNEASPDLSQQILTAANEQSSQQSTLAIGDEEMNGNHEKARKSRKLWLSLTVAASLLVATGLMFSGDFLQTSKKLAKTQASAVVTLSSEEVKPTDSTAYELEGNATFLGTTVPVPEDNRVLLGDIKRLSEEKKNDEFMMAVTPHIIIQEEEEIRLGIAGTELEEERPGLTSGGRGRMGLQGVINEGTGSLQTQEGNTGLPERLARGEMRAKAAEALSLGIDPKIANFQDEKYAIARQLRQQQSRIPGSSLLEIESLQQQLRRIEQEESTYRRTLDENGEGPGTSSDQYTRIYENPFIAAKGDAAVSTFSIDVDTASYANVRQFLMQANRMPPPDAVRIEELVNYFDYDYSVPTGEVPFASHVEIAGCPWQPEHRLVRIGIKGREVETKNRPQSNLVFLIDVSGSMNNPAKLPLLVEGLKMLTRQLSENDRVAIVVYASSEGLALDSTRGDQQDTILAALNNLRAGGSTAGGAGIQLAYQIAEDHFIQGGTNRVILATDGDFNVGTTSTAELERLAESKAKETGVFLTVLGFGRGNLNDAMMEAISGKGNGNYHYLDNQTEARKVLVEEMTGTLMTIAKDVKIQIEFNPAQVAGYRLLGYENRMLRTEDFNDDKKDAGEIGAGHTVTALYEIVPAGKSIDATKVDPLKYQEPAKEKPDAPVSGPISNDLLTLKIRYKLPESDTSTKLEFPITDANQPFSEATADFKFAAAVASFGMQLRNSEHCGTTSLDAVLEIAESSLSRDPHGYRAEFMQLVRKAKELSGE